MKHIAFSTLALSGATLLLFSLSPATAQVPPGTVEFAGSNDGAGVYSIDLTKDLLDGATAIDSTNTSRFSMPYADGGTYGGLSVLTDGAFGGSSDSGNLSNTVSATAGSYGGTSATYSLGSDPLGYTINSTEVYSGWNDDGRYQQAYTLSFLPVATVADPDPTFVDLYTVSPYPSGAYSGGDTSTRAETDLTSSNGILVTGVSEVKITFNNVVNNWTGYREFAVNGTPILAPEPSTIALMLAGLAATGVLARRYRKSS